MGEVFMVTSAERMSGGDWCCWLVGAGVAVDLVGCFRFLSPDQSKSQAGLEVCFRGVDAGVVDCCCGESWLSISGAGAGKDGGLRFAVTFPWV
jgi:hypothetical protein